MRRQSWFLEFHAQSQLSYTSSFRVWVYTPKVSGRSRRFPMVLTSKRTLSSRARHPIAYVATVAMLPPVWFVGISQTVWGNGRAPFYSSMTEFRNC